MKPEKTFTLTQHELDQIDSVRIINEQQKLMLELNKRSGIRYGVNVGGGIFNIVKCAHAINRKGMPTGVATVETVRGGLRWEEVVPAIRELLADLPLVVASTPCGGVQTDTLFVFSPADLFEQEDAQYLMIGQPDITIQVSLYARSIGEEFTVNVWVEEEGAMYHHPFRSLDDAKAKAIEISREGLK